MNRPPLDDIIWLKQVGNRFRAAWNRGERPRIHDLLIASPGPRQADLLSYLLGIELELRWKAGECPEIAEYLGQFPEHAGVIQRVFQRDRNRGFGVAGVAWRNEWELLPEQPVEGSASPAESRSPPTVAEAPALDSMSPPTERDTLSPVNSLSPPTLGEHPQSEFEKPDKADARNIVNAIVHGPANAIGRFEVRELLGQGAFGRVYRSYDPQLDREVALKVAKPGLLTSRAGSERFLREARAAAQLRHPHIIPVFDAGQDGEHYYIASAFISGRTLEATLSQGPMPARRAAQIVKQLADALDYAHDQGVVHRDVKPANVMIDDRGQALLADFGLASRLDAEKLTHEGMILGTPLYMAPEQADARAGDPQPASDQYSLGVVLYELLTGQPPFTGTVEIVIYHHRRTEPVPPRRHNSRIPRDLETICLKALSKNPAHRYTGCYQLSNDLRRWLEDEPIQARALGRTERFVRWCKRDPLFAGAAAVVILLLVALAMVQRAYAKRAETAAYEANLVRSEKERALTNLELTIQQREKEAADKRKEAKLKEEALARVLRSARSFAYVRALAEAQHQMQTGNRTEAEQLLQECPIDLRGWEWCLLRNSLRAKTGNAQPGTTIASAAQNIAFSRDSRFIAYSTSSELEVIEAGTGKAVFHFKSDAGPVRALAFSPADDTLAAACGSVRAWHIPGGQEEFTLKEEGAAYVLAWSPDGKRLALATEKENTFLHRNLTTGKNRKLHDGRFAIWNVETRQKVRDLESHLGRVLGMAFSPDGSRLACSLEASDVIKLFAVESGQEFPKSFEAIGGGTSALAYSPDGQLLAGSHGPGVVLWQVETGKVGSVLQGHRKPVTRLAFSPDGRRLVSGSADGAIKTWDLELGQETFTLDGHRAEVHGLAFSPDGNLLASVGQELKVWNADLEPNALVLRGHTSWVSHAAVSPDSRLVASASSDKSVWIWESATGRILRRLPPQDGPISRVAFSPDGRRLATGTGEWADRLASPVGKQIVRGRRVRAPGTVKVWDVASGDEIKEAGASADTIFGLAFRPDGKYLAYSAVHLEEKSRQEVRKVAPDSRSPLDRFGLDPFRGTGSQFQPYDPMQEYRKYTSDPFGSSSQRGGASSRFSPYNTSPGYRDPFGGSAVGRSSPWGRSGMPDVQIPGMTPHPQNPFDNGSGSGFPALGSNAPPQEIYENVTVTYTETKSQPILVSLDGEQPAPFYANQSNTVLCFAFRPDGQGSAAGSDDGTAKVWDEMGQLRFTLPEKQENRKFQVLDIAFSPDGQRLAYAASAVHLWEVGGTTARELAGYGRGICRIAFSPDGKRLATGDLKGTISVWDPAKKEPVRSFRAHDDEITSLCFAADGRLVSTSYDQTIKVWNRSMGEPADGR